MRLKLPLYVMRFANTWPIPPTSLHQLRNSYDNYALPIEGISVKQNSDIERAATVEIVHPQVRRTNAGCRYGGCRLRQGGYYRSCQNSQSARGYPSECGYTVDAKGQENPATITPTDTRINIPHARASVTLTTSSMASGLLGRVV
jgi:hypothetical protein